MVSDVHWRSPTDKRGLHIVDMTLFGPTIGCSMGKAQVTIELQMSVLGGILEII